MGSTHLQVSLTKISWLEKSGVAVPTEPEPLTPPTEKFEKRDGLSRYAIDGKVRLESNSAIEIVVATLSELTGIIPNFLSNFEARMLEHRTSKRTQKRKWVSQNREDLYSNKNLLKASKPLPGGWWLGTNYSNLAKSEILELAKELAAEEQVRLDFELA